MNTGQPGAVGFAAALLLSGGIVTAQAAPMMDYYGIISCAEGQGGCTPSTGGGGSSQPARLFGFNAGDTSATFYGDITMDGSGVDADALAYTSVFDGTLFAFALDHTNSRSTLMSFDIAGLVAGGPTAAGTSIGSAIDGLDARGATFIPGTGDMAVLDSNGDSTNATLGRFSISSTGGSFSAAGTALGQLDRPVSTASDIAFNAAGELILAAEVGPSAPGTWGFSLISPPSGGGTTFTSSLLTRDELGDSDSTRQAYAGLAMSTSGAFGYDVNNHDDIYSLNPVLPGPTLGAGDRTRTINGLTTFNAGRGDLTSTLPAVATVPEPGALALMGLGLLSLGALRRRQAT